MRLALIAHDEKKPDLIAFAEERKADLERFELIATGTTGQRLIDATGLDIDRKESGRSAATCKSARRLPTRPATASSSFATR